MDYDGGAAHDIGGGQQAATRPDARSADLQRIHARALPVAAAITRSTLRLAVDYLHARRLPCQLALRSAGPGGQHWHTVAQRTGWLLGGDEKHPAFLGEDALISLGGSRPATGRLLAAGSVEFHPAAIGWAETRRIVNPRDLLPVSGTAVLLDGYSPWQDTPEWLIAEDPASDRVRYLWPPGRGGMAPHLCFDPSGQVWCSGAEWDLHWVHPFEEWLSSLIARALAGA
jgi:hypothetical protein